MVCKYCGKEVKDGVNFCNHCGAGLSGRAAPTGSPYGDNRPPDINSTQPYPQPQEYRGGAAGSVPKKGKNPVIIVIVIVLVVGAITIFLRSGTLDINLVKSGAPKARPDVTWGEALGNVSEDGKWKAYREDGNRYVKYTGKVKSSGDELEVIFRIKGGGNFSAEKISIGSDVYIAGEDDNYMYKVISDIFDNKL